MRKLRRDPMRRSGSMLLDTVPERHLDRSFNDESPLDVMGMGGDNDFSVVSRDLDEKDLRMPVVVYVNVRPRQIRLWECSNARWERHPLDVSRGAV